MRRQEIITAILAVAAIATWNFVDWMRMGAPGNGRWWKGNAAGTPEPELWQHIKSTSLDERPDGGIAPTFHESVVAADGTRVELPGVGFLLASGLEGSDQGEEVVTEFLLLPGSGGVAWCCGLTAIPCTEFGVLVECPDAPFLASKADPKSSAVFVSVEGILRLEKKNSIDALYTLENAAIEFIDLEDVLPPNVLNRCLNQPMTPWLNEQGERTEPVEPSIRINSAVVERRVGR